jgi:2Fe-2S ferredoxin
MSKSTEKAFPKPGPPAATFRVRFFPVNIEVLVPAGTAVLDAALDNNIKIDHNCGGNCACSTCHVIIEEGFDSLNAASEDEEDMLDEVEALTESSRLACQCQVRENLAVRIPERGYDLDNDGS